MLSPGSNIPAIRPEAIKAIPLRHPWRWVAALVVLLFAAAVIYTFATAPGLNWGVVKDFLFFPEMCAPFSPRWNSR